MMKPYESYKETNIPWVSQAPKHWDVLRAKNLYYKKNNPALQDDDVITCFRDGQVTLRKNRRTSGFTESIKEIGYQHIDSGDLVIHVMDAFAGAVGVSDSSGKGTPVYSVCGEKMDINNYYYAHIVRQMAITGYIQSLYRGIRERSSDFRFEVFASQSLPVPPRSEQDQIVRYLDWQLTKINKLIKAKRKQIELLNEQKQAIINKAVTKGLDDTVPMKDSGVDWIGEIPEDWEVIKTKHLFCEVNDTGHPTLPYLSITNDMGVVLQSETGRKNRVSENLLMYKRIMPGDIGYNLMNAFIGSLGVSKHEGIISPAYAVCRPKIEMNVWYFHYLYKTKLYMQEFDNNSYGIMIERNRLYFDNFKEIISILPPFADQNKIVAYIDYIFMKFSKVIATVEKEIDLLAEYKTSLISSVVTGKVDVREIEIPDFEIDDDQQNIDEIEDTDDVEELEVE